jgi:hypothetical protein
MGVNMFRYPAAALAITALLCGSALAQEPDIVVVGERLEEMTSSFVQQVSVASTREDQLARWDEQLCVGAAGLTPEDGQRLVDRISMRASAVGLRIGQSGCRANVMIIYAPDSDVLTRQIVDRRPELLGYYSNDAVSTGGREGLQDFANTPRPVRWWHVARNVTMDGRVLDNPNSQPAASGAESAAATAAAAAGVPGTGLGATNGAQVVRSNGTRLSRTTRQDINYVLIIVDARRVADIPADSWFDYVAMISLAQINPNATPSEVPTILNLFTASAETAPSEMTAWDVAFLDGLYRATREAVNSRQQRSEIQRSMVTTLASERPN